MDGDPRHAARRRKGIDLDEPVRRYLPNFQVADDAVSEAVTIRHLLTHTSGIDGDHFADTGRGDGALRRYVETCAELPQVHPLGATMSYCNTGYTVLGRMLEVVTDTVWDDLLRTRLIQPLELTHTVTLPEDVLRFRAAIGHIQPPGQELRPAPGWGLRVPRGRPERSARRRVSSWRSPGCISGTGSAPMASGC